MEHWWKIRFLSCIRFERRDDWWFLYLSWRWIFVPDVFDKICGVDPDSGEALYWAKDENGVEYKDKDWSAYNSNRQASGDLLPTIYGGVGTTLEFRGFDFSIQCAYQLGGTIYDSGYQAFMHGGDSHYMGYNWHKDILNAWTPENRNTNIPRVDAIDKYTNSSSDRWLTSSDYFSINNITLGYTLPKRWLRSLGIGSLRIYGAADNVALSLPVKGLIHVWATQQLLQIDIRLYVLFPAVWK